MSALLIYLAIAVGVSFVCSLLESTFLSINPVYAQSFQKENPEVGEKLIYLKEHVDRSLSSILVTNTFANTFGAFGVGTEAILLFGAEWETFIAIGMTLTILYVSEIVPKTLGAVYWRELTAFVTIAIYWLIKITYPLLWVSSAITRYIRHDDVGLITRDEIAAMADMGREEGVLYARESAWVNNILKLKDIRVGDIYTPKSVIFSLQEDMTIDEAIEKDDLFVYSRVPVYKEHFDDCDGYVFSKQVLEEGADDNEEMKIKKLKKKIRRIKEKVPIPQLIDKFIKKKEHMFLVVDKYEQPMGIVTLEDAIETLLGEEIVDEMDRVVDLQRLAHEKAGRFRRLNPEDKEH